MTSLRISSKLTLPAEAVTQTFGCLGVRGSGKSNTAVVLAEEMYRAKLPFVAIDPKPDWWGIQSSADGKAAGLDVPVFGAVGEVRSKHRPEPNMPLEPTAGVFLADLVVSERLSCVLDVSAFSEANKIRFLLDFATRLYQRNEDALHLFLEEADDYIPQKPFKEQARLVHIFSKIVKLGRARGLGATIITQRSAVVNKNVLTQIGTLIAHRTTSPQDRKAIQGWVDFHGQSREIVDSLPSLEDGEAWVWSPQWLKCCDRVQIRRRQTFDSGATPKAGKSRPAVRLAEIDLPAIQARMAETIERAKAEDPKELKKTIAELRKELSAKPQRPSGGADPRIIERSIGKAVAENERKWQASFTNLQRHARALETKLQKITALANVDGHAPVVEPPKRAPITAPRVSAERAAPAVAARRTREAAAPPAEGLTRKQQEIIDAAAWWESVGVPEPSTVQVGAIAMIDATGGYFSSCIGPLVTGGLVERGGGTIRLTDAGRSAARPMDQIASLADYHEMLRARVRQSRNASGKTVAILDAVIDANGEELTTEQIGEVVGVDPTGGYFSSCIGPLSTLGLIERSAGRVRPTGLLFPSGL